MGNRKFNFSYASPAQRASISTLASLLGPRVRTHWYSGPYGKAWAESSTLDADPVYLIVEQSGAVHTRKMEETA